MLVKVALAGAVYSIDKPYTYRVPDSLAEEAKPGVRAVVPFGRGNRRREAFILTAFAEEENSADSTLPLKTILMVLDESPVLDDEGIRLALWMTERYYCTFFDAFRAMVPTGLLYTFAETRAKAGEVSRGEDFEQFTARRRVRDKTELIAALAVEPEEAREAAAGRGRSAHLQKSVLNLLSDLCEAASHDICYFTGCSMPTLRALERSGFITLTEQEAFRPVRHERVKPQDVNALMLTPEQKSAFTTLSALLEARKPAAALLHGVTGSGKTSVYVKLIDSVLSQGGQALMLVPEIALTPQLMEKFSSYFGARVALLHSGLSAAQRLDEWKRIRQGLASVVIGARSAVFAPLANLRLIILDEEHEPSYKSDSAPRYHTRDVAKYRSMRANALLLLGSATPDVESRYAAAQNRYQYVPLLTRYNAQKLPLVITADMRAEARQGFDGTVGSCLREELRKNIELGQQSILFLNRRGYNRCLVCLDCGEAPVCPRCSVSLTYHAVNNRLMCHFCGHSEPNAQSCPRCEGRLRPVGAGTQRVQQELEEIFPGVPILRMDADTTAGRDGHRKLLDRFRAENVPILVGTQMVAKGLDFPNVTLVGVINADAALYVDDYRAGERAFALLTQVVGRAGRAEKPGRAVIQTLNPAHPVLELAAKQDYEGFFESELMLRRGQCTPPFTELIKLSVFGLVSEAARSACLRLRVRLEQAGLPVRVFGPAPASVGRVNNLFRFQLILSGENTAALRHMVSESLRAFPQDKRNKGVHVYADYKPNGF